MEKDFPKNAAVISFYDPPGKFRDAKYRPVDYSAKTNCVFQVALYDIDLAVLPKYHLTYETYFPEADDLAEFIFTAKREGKDIICQCEYGESRSSGCAAAIHEYFYNDGIKIFVKERIEGGANEKAVLRLFINCPFVCINFDFFWLNKARQLYMDF